MSHRSSIAIRFALALLFLWFGAEQMLSPSQWTGFLPMWTGYLPVPAETFVRLNGLFELIGAGMLGFGVYTRLIALLLGLHLGVIAIAVGGAIGVRDAVLAAVTVALAGSTPDAWTVDARTKG